MSKWLADVENGEGHVVPLDDAIPHIRAAICPCHPFVEDLGYRTLIVHHAADGREYSEPGMLAHYQERPC